MTTSKRILRAIRALSIPFSILRGNKNDKTVQKGTYRIGQLLAL